jgi:phenylalanine-4-hydroxylase
LAFFAACSRTGPGAAARGALRYAPEVETHPVKGDVDRSPPDCIPADIGPHPPSHGGPIPDYLQPFIVEQDPRRYTAVDQAVWRFVLLQLTDLLQHSAHRSYARGLVQSAISPERIPSIGEVASGLAAIGWSAVCVDGFIPPRAFQAFQALGILPIAAEIRTPEHLPYTPAPDIIHEAAGHAPILVDPVYAAYVRAVGEVGTRAFASPADARIDRAVRLLSELKEHPTTDAALGAAEHELERAVAELGPASEAARISRLYWWTAEYGLVGTPSDYRLYGAGLLSSLGESHFCHAPAVRKLPLSAECTRFGYDITRPQPQLFVARDFEHLHSVLEEVSQTLAYDVGGEQAVHTALASAELCTVYFPGGVQVIGKPQRLGTHDPRELLGFERGAALAWRGQLLGRVGSFVVALGKLADGTDPRRLAAGGAELTGADGRLAVVYASGVRASGVPCNGPWPPGEGVLWLRDFRVSWRGGELAVAEPYPWLLADRAVTAGAGSASPDVSPLDMSVGAPPAQRIRVPKPKRQPQDALRLERLYADAAEARRQGVRGKATLDAVHTELGASYPYEWLLRWNVLSTLIELGMGHYAGRHPIALGLDYLAALRGAA